MSKNRNKGNGKDVEVQEKSSAPRPDGERRGLTRPVSRLTIERLSVYRRTLKELIHEDVKFIHSHQLASLVGVTPAQLRRDLASFGSFGNVVKGYNVREMDRTLSQIMGTDIPQPVALFGLGDLGRALLSYGGFQERGFNLVAVFEKDQEKVGKVFAGRRCYGLDSLEQVVEDMGVRIAILATNPEGLQSLVDRAAAAGVRAFLNFVPKLVTTPPDCSVEDIDISSRLEKLSFLSRNQSG